MPTFVPISRLGATPLRYVEATVSYDEGTGAAWLPSNTLAHISVKVPCERGHEATQ